MWINEFYFTNGQRGRAEINFTELNIVSVAMNVFLTIKLR